MADATQNSILLGVAAIYAVGFVFIAVAHWLTWTPYRPSHNQWDRIGESIAWASIWPVVVWNRRVFG